MKILSIFIVVLFSYGSAFSLGQSPKVELATNMDFPFLVVSSNGFLDGDSEEARKEQSEGIEQACKDLSEKKIQLLELEGYTDLVVSPCQYVSGFVGSLLGITIYRAYIFHMLSKDMKDYQIKNFIYKAKSLGSSNDLKLYSLPTSI